MKKPQDRGLKRKSVNSVGLGIRILWQSIIGLKGLQYGPGFYPEFLEGSANHTLRLTTAKRLLPLSTLLTNLFSIVI